MKYYTGQEAFVVGINLYSSENFKRQQNLVMMLFLRIRIYSER